MTDTVCPVCAQEEQAYLSPLADRCPFHQTLGAQMEELTLAARAVLASLSWPTRLLVVVLWRMGMLAEAVSSRWPTMQRAISQEYPRKWIPLLGMIWLAGWLLYTFFLHNPEGFVIFGLVQVVWVFTRISLRYRKVRRRP